ncbi:MAG: ATP--guanido phosphotransferase [Clostridia bacterium]|nr:ATP--guanido phosphotransferase [Clostridia bacterium]
MAESIKSGSNRHLDTVLSTRVRLARNIDGVPFPVRLNSVEKQSINIKICEILSLSEQKLQAIEMSSLYPYEAISLAERHLISPEFASMSEGRVLLLSEDEKISIMLCEKDHVRIQGFEEGLDLENAYKNAEVYDEILDSSLHFAFDPKLGYLNQNPKDIGTGMKASVMMHLPALSRTGAMTKLSATSMKLGFNIRGSYGDAASVKGDIFRISNSVTMGISEEEALENLKTLVLQIATKERAAAEKFVTDINIKDRINRSVGLLQNAVLLSSDEMMELLSWVRLGALYGIVEADPHTIAKLFTAMQPATINVLAKQKLPESVRDEIRAKTVKQALKS